MAVKLRQWMCDVTIVVSFIYEWDIGEWREKIVNAGIRVNERDGGRLRMSSFAICG